MAATERVDLSQQMLAAVPSHVVSLTGLAHLVLDSNRISAFPADLQSLPFLVSLSLKWNALTSVSDAIGRCATRDARPQL